MKYIAYKILFAIAYPESREAQNCVQSSKFYQAGPIKIIITLSATEFKNDIRYWKSKNNLHAVIFKF